MTHTVPSCQTASLEVFKKNILPHLGIPQISRQNFERNMREWCAGIESQHHLPQGSVYPLIQDRVVRKK